MGTRERRQREFENREQAFLAAARELVDQEGLLNLQMSRVAERSEYAVGTLYQHFSSKEDLLVALVTEDVRHHADLFECVARWQAPTRDRMFAICVADAVFSHNNPAHYQLAQYVFCEVVWNAASPARREALMETAAPIRRAVIGIVEAAVAQGDLQLRDLTPSEITAGAWCLASGMHKLAHARGVLQHFTVSDPARLMCSQMQTMLNGLGWQPLFDCADAPALDALIERIRNEVFDDGCRTSTP